VLEFLGSPQQFLNVLGDLFRLQDDILRAGKPRVEVSIQAFQLRVEVFFLAQLQKPLSFQSKQRVPTLRVLVVAVGTAAVAGKLARVAASFLGAGQEWGGGSEGHGGGRHPLPDPVKAGRDVY